MIHLPSEWKKIVEEVLHQYVPDRRVVIFGSRAVGNPKPFSDIDLCVMGEKPLSAEVMSELKNAFVESDLPVRVDVIDWATTSSRFRKVVEQRNEEISLEKNKSRV